MAVSPTPERMALEDPEATGHSVSFCVLWEPLAPQQRGKEEPMTRSPGLKRLAVVLGALWMLNGIAWAQPTDPANLPQILNVRTYQGIGGKEQRTFLPTGPISFEASYYDPSAACAGVAPVFVQWFLFNLEGKFLAGEEFAGSDPFTPTSKYRLLFLDLVPNSLAPDSYRFTFLVRSCNDSISVVLPEFLMIRVVAP